MMLSSPIQPAWLASSQPARRRRWPLALFIASSSLLAVFLVSFLVYEPMVRSVARATASVCKAQSFTVPYTIADQDAFQDLSEAGNAAWDSLFTPNGAYLYRQMPSAETGEDEIRTYGVSMFHQLHCLSMIRLQLQALNATAHGETPPASDHHLDMGAHHWLHCLDYLRQAVLCAADDTLEPPERSEEDAHFDLVTGQGPRMCRDSAHLYEWSRLSGDNIKTRRKALSEGKEWPALEGVEWPAPFS